MLKQHINEKANDTWPDLKRFLALMHQVKAVVVSGGYTLSIYAIIIKLIKVSISLAPVQKTITHNNIYAESKCFLRPDQIKDEITETQ